MTDLIETEPEQVKTRKKAEENWIQREKAKEQVKAKAKAKK